VRPAPLPKAGPFDFSARLILVGLGAIIVPLTVIHLVDEMQRHEYIGLYAVVVAVGILGFLLSLFLAYRGSLLAAIAVGVLAFGELALQVSTHFAAGPTDLSTLVPTQGMWFIIVLLFLGTACLLELVVALVATINGDGWARQIRSLPLLAVSVTGASLFLLHAAYDVRWKGFGGLNVEDGALLAMVTAALWILGALWTASAIRRGTILVSVSTLNVWWPFYTLHLGPSGVSLTAIGHRSGLGFALIAAGAALLAAYAFLVAILWLGFVSMPPHIRARVTAEAAALLSRR
jgi:hypothetical protein